MWERRYAFQSQGEHSLPAIVAFPLPERSREGSVSAQNNEAPKIEHLNVPQVGPTTKIMKIGYARVSTSDTSDQTLALQQDALKSAGVTLRMTQ